MAKSDRIPLDRVIATDELTRRPSRPADYESESRAIAGVLEALARASDATDADRVLQQLVESVLRLCRAHSAGVSVLEEEDGAEIFRWRAVAGRWAPLAGGSMPRGASPCGTVLHHDRPILMAHPERHYGYATDAPPIVETLLIPFHSEGKPVGTVWIIAHDETRKFDAEDLRVLTSLSRSAATAYRVLVSHAFELEITARREIDRRLETELVERRRTEATLREADRRKDEFLATLAHELRNPLAPVRNAVQILKMKGSQNTEVRWAQDVIDRQIQQMSRLIDDLLDVSRIHRDRMELRREPVELARIIHGAVETCRPFVDECGHALTVTLPEAPVRVHADVTRMSQVLSNLLNNAAKYSDRGGRIHLRAERDGESVVIAVSDGGIGIAPEMLPRIFDPFTQADRSLERTRGGLGIGLTLVKRIVEMHGGSVSASSDGDGKGSEFSVRLPIYDGPSAPEPPESPEPAATRAPGRRRVLIVDDNLDASASLGLVLRSLGYETRAAGDGLAGFEAAAEFRPDVALLDLGMPKLNGYDLARRIRGEPWGQGMLLIAVTGWGQDQDRARSADAGFDHHLVKPIAPVDIARRLATAWS